MMGIGRLVWLVPLWLVAMPGIAGRGGTDQEARMAEVIEVVRDLGEIPEKAIPPALLNQAEGIAVIPHVVKIGLIVGGRYGVGVVMVRKDDGSWSDPAFVSLKGGSVGWQIGAHATDLVLVFRARESLDEVTSGEFTLGADAAVAAGPLGRKASASTDLELTAPIYAYSRSQGLFAGLAINGAVLRIKPRENEAYYGRPGITVEDIFAGQAAKTLDSAEELKQLLSVYAEEPSGE